MGHAAEATCGGDARLRRGERFVRADYRRTFAEGKSFPSRSFVAWVLETEEPDAPARLGVVVSKRTFPLSVERNRAKRLMREAFRRSKGYFGKGRWILLIGRRRITGVGVTGAAVTQEFRSFCRKAGLCTGGK